ncbi:hypothetical protein PFISCL1PPCAC_20179, partial [Pristionchus fissidentatus]
ISLTMTDLAEEEPYVAVVNDTMIHQVCSHCFNCDTSNLRRCLGCLELHYCSELCQREDWHVHKAECKLLSLFPYGIPPSDIRLLTRLLIRKKKGDERNVISFNGKSFDQLTHNMDDIDYSSWSNEFGTIVTQLYQYVYKKYILPEHELAMEYISVMKGQLSDPK